MAGKTLQQTRGSAGAAVLSPHWKQTAVWKPQVAEQVVEAVVGVVIACEPQAAELILLTLQWRQEWVQACARH